MLTAATIRSDQSSPTHEIPTVLADSYLPSLDGLRAISILMVTGAHLGLAYKSYDEYLHPIARLGVQFFFVISGFLITTLLLKEKLVDGTISLKRFYIRRFFRIIPVAYLYLLVIVLLNAVLHLHMNYYYIVLSFLFLRNFAMTAKGADHLTTHYWSLAVEEQFYLIFPVILKKSIAYFTVFLTLMMLFPIAFDTYNLYTTTSNQRSAPITVFIQFMSQFQAISVGALCSIFLFKVPVNLRVLAQQKTMFTCLFFGFIGFLLFLRHELLSLNNLLMSFLFAAILILNLDKSPTTSFKFLNNRYMKLIGVLSYSMYIWQTPIAYSLTVIEKLRFFQPYKNSTLVYGLITTGSTIAIVLVAYVSYFFYEKPFLKLKSKFK